MRSVCHGQYMHTTVGADLVLYQPQALLPSVCMRLYIFIDRFCRFLAKVWGKTGSKLYGSRSGSDYIDNHKRFTLFCKAAIESVRALPFGPGEDCVFVANDWHSALVPILLKVGCQTVSKFRQRNHDWLLSGTTAQSFSIILWQLRPQFARCSAHLLSSLPSVSSTDELGVTRYLIICRMCTSHLDSSRTPRPHSASTTSLSRAVSGLRALRIWPCLSQLSASWVSRMATARCA